MKISTLLKKAACNLLLFDDPVTTDSKEETCRVFTSSPRGDDRKIYWHLRLLAMIAKLSGNTLPLIILKVAML